MNRNIAIRILKEELATTLLKTYSVTQFCDALGITRSVFYSRYSSMPDLFSDAIQHEIHQHFLDYRDYDTEQIIYAYLKQIDRTRLFYINVYHLASKNASRHICQDISNAFFKEMQTHLFNSDYSNNHIKGFTSVLFSHVTDWLAHGHKKNQWSKIYVAIKCVKKGMPLASLLPLNMFDHVVVSTIANGHWLLYFVTFMNIELLCTWIFFIHI